jgi:beta-glucanase (GH16 family)
MRVKYYLMLGMLLLLSRGVYAQKKWKLVWSDEFNYNGLPDSNKWSFEEGNVRDGESEYYTKNRLANARVANGVLTITARKEEFVNPHFADFKKTQRGQKYFTELMKYPKQFRNKPVDSVPAWVKNRYDSLAHYTSASIVTKGKASWKYGRIEVRAKLPQGRGVLPAAWLLGNNITTVGWPKCGEIDIMEFVGRVPGEIYGHVHYADPITTNHVSSGQGYNLIPTTDGFHIYAVEWNSQTISFSCDNKVYFTYEVDKAKSTTLDPFRQPFYFLLNMSLGGSFGGKVDPSIFPQEYQIDYVRIYQ